MLRAVIAAEEFIKSNPAESIRILSSHLALEKPYLDEVLKKDTFHVQLDQRLLSSLDEMGRWLMKTGVVRNQTLPNFLEAVALTPLLNVKAEAVGIIR